MELRHLPGQLAMPDDSREQFDTLLRDWSAAIVANDAETFDRFVAPEWALVSPHGDTVFRAQYLAVVESGDLTHDTMSHDLLRVDVLGDIAVVTSRVTNSGAFRGEAFQADEWTIDVFVRQEDRWRCTQTCLTPVAGPAA